MKKRIFSMVIAAMMAVSLAGCGAGKSQNTAGTQASEIPSQDTPAKTTFTVGFDKEFPPMGFVDESGQYVGFDLELAAEAAKRMGLEFVAQPVVWDSKDMELESGTIDCIWNGFTITGREDQYTWSDPYMKNSQVIVTKKDSGIAAKENLAGKNVEVQADSSGLRALEAMPEFVETFKSLNQVADYNTAFMDLEMGAADAIVIDVIVAGYQIEKRGGTEAPFAILEDELSAEDYGIGFKLGNETLRDQVQAVLNEMAADGTMKVISEKWFGKDVMTTGK